MFFGVVLYVVEVNTAGKDTLFPKAIISGASYSVWYTTCVTIGVFFGESHPRSQVARVIVLVFKYISVLALVSLNARVILAIEPAKDGAYTCVCVCVCVCVVHLSCTHLSCTSPLRNTQTPLQARLLARLWPPQSALPKR